MVEAGSEVGCKDMSLSSFVVDSGCGKGLSRCASVAVASSVLFRIIGVARGDKSSGNFLTSSSVAFLKSWSNGLASSLKSPTSSQFFKKRVGVGVWSEKRNILHIIKKKKKYRYTVTLTSRQQSG